MQKHSSASGLSIARGHCYVFFAYDVAAGIDLDAAHRQASGPDRREHIRHKRRTPAYFTYRVPPLLIAQPSDAIDIGRWKTLPHVGCLVFDFGAVSVMYTIPLSGAMGDLVELSDALYENRALMDDSGRRVRVLLEELRAAVKRPWVAPQVEDYAVFHAAIIEGVGPGETPESALARCAPLVASILRSEPGPMSEQERAEALSAAVSYSPADAAYIDWNAAVVAGPEVEDVRAVLEYANVELLEMRILDARLDDALDESYATLAGKAWRHLIPGLGAKDLRRISGFHVDSAALFEGVSNALKLVGDQYLARVYRAASQRLHLGEWDATIARKLAALDSIYHKLSDYQTTRRLEVLEWIIIILIAVEVFRSLWAN